MRRRRGGGRVGGGGMVGCGVGVWGMGGGVEAWWYGRLVGKYKDILSEECRREVCIRLSAGQKMSDRAAIMVRSGQVDS